MDENQYTVRGVSKKLDLVARRRAREDGVSLNRLVLRALENEVGQGSRERNDLDWLSGSWVEDAVFDQALDEQRKVNLADWQ